MFILNRTTLLVSIGTLLGACGRVDYSEIRSLQGDDRIFRGQDCQVSISESQDGSLARITLHGTFTIDYKIPTPGSGFFGKYQWEGNFDSEHHFSRGELNVRRSWLGDADVIEGRGQPIFWDGSSHHKIIVKPSLLEPKVVNYQSTERILGTVPVVTISAECELREQD